MAPNNESILRTPEDRFANLPGFPYTPKYLTNGELRMAYIDERNNGTGGSGTEIFLCLHGEPTWSYLYRKMIPVFLNYSTLNGGVSRRVVAPDLFGFGRSDKPVADSTYDFDFHRESLLYFIRTLDLQNVTLVVQDWGGLLGLTIPVTEQKRIKRLIVMNTSLATGKGVSQGFLDWRAYVKRSPDMDVGALMGRSSKSLSEAEKQAYSAPFPDIRYKAGVRRFPQMVMVEPSLPGIEISKKSVQFYKEKDHFRARDIFMACGLQDLVLGKEPMGHLAQMWKNGCYYTDLPEAGHFVQEWGDVVAKAAIDVFESSEDFESKGSVYRVGGKRSHI